MLKLSAEYYVNLSFHLTRPFHSLIAPVSPHTNPQNFPLEFPVRDIQTVARREC